MSCCTSLRGCRTPTPTTSLGTCRKGCTGITVISMGSRRRRSMRVSWVCFAVGRTDGNLPLVTEKHIPVRNMALQYNFVFDRAGGLAQLNNLSWPQWVNTIIPPKAGELENGTYRPSLAPVNFKQSKLGTKYVTVWYAGPLSINNHRGQLEFIPSNLQQFTGADPKAGSDVPANPSLPDYQRDVQSFPNVPLIQPPLNSAAPRWMAARPCICRAPNTMVMAPSSARSRASSHSADPAARGWRRPVRRPAPISWSAVPGPGARTQALSNTISSGRMRRRRRWKRCVSDKSGPEKDLHPASAAIRTWPSAARRRTTLIGMAAATASLSRERALLERQS